MHNTQTKKNVPELRFPEFEGEWEEKKLGEVASITKLAGFEFTKYVEYSSKGEIIAIRGLNVKNGRFYLNDVKYIDNSDFSKLNRSKLLAKDIVYTYVGTVGEAGIVPKDKNWYLAPNVAKIRVSKVLPDFLYYYITRPNFRNKEVGRWIATSSQPSLSMENIRKFIVKITAEKEQQKIGNFFSKLDQQIELAEKKVSLLQEQKKGYMQKIFSQQLRFKDENGNDYPEWEEKKLGDISKIIGGGTPTTSNQDYWDGEINWFTPMEIGNKRYVSKSMRTITERGLQKSSAKMLPAGTVLFTSRAGIGKTAILEKESTTNQGFQSILPVQNELDSYYLFSLTPKIKQFAEIHGAGSTFVEISGKELSKMKIKLPSIYEQQKIGSFFSKLDQRIELAEQKVEQLKEQKRGLLQKMFV